MLMFTVFKIISEEAHYGDHIKHFLAGFFIVFNLLKYTNASPYSDPAGN